MSSLSEMPELVLENIIGFSDFRSVLTLRQVCRDFRNFVDDLKDSKLPTAKIKEIIVFAGKTCISLIYRDLDRSIQKFTYSGEEKSRSFNGKTTNLENSNILDVAMRDLEFVLKFQKLNVDLLNLRLFDSQPQNDSWIDTSPVELSKLLQKFNRKIRTKSLLMKTDSQHSVMSILPFIEPGTLEVLLLAPLIDETEIEINDIVKTEQWRGVKTNYFYFVPLGLDVKDICHFPKNYMKVLSISAAELDSLRKTFISSSNLNYCYLYMKNFNEREELSKYWGPAFSNRPTYYWYFRRKDSEEQVLQICIRKNEDTEFLLNFIQLSDVLTGAVVHAYNEN